MKKILIFLALVCHPLYSQPAIINKDSDYYILDQFFRKMIKDELFGYVIEGTKPLSALDIFSINEFLFPHSPFFQWRVIGNEAIELWQQLNLDQKNLILKVTKGYDHEDNEYHELLFINRSKTKEIIDKNLDLFRLIVGSTLDTSTLVRYICNSSKSLVEIIKNNNVLLGILLGYGTFNSLIGSRAEEIDGIRAMDFPPFIGNNLLQLEVRQSADWHLKTYFLSNCDLESQQGEERAFIHPALGYATIKEEIETIQALKEELPTALIKEKPCFIFGAYKNSDNKKLFEEAKDSQKQIKNLLLRSDLVEYVLHKITEEKPVINCLHPFNKMKIPIEGKAEEAVAEVLLAMAKTLDHEMIPVFIETFCNNNFNKLSQPKRRYLSGVLNGLKEARTNLITSERQIVDFSKRKNVEEIIPQHLCFERLKHGKGKILNKSTDVLLSYVIEDCRGNILSAQHKCWVNLSNTLPSFSHGLQEMREGETRQIYIHPAYGYGALTTISPCTLLVTRVTLHKIKESASENLPALIPIDLSWVKNDQFFEEVKEICYQDARYLGYIWKDWLSKSSDLNFSEMCNILKSLAESNFEMPSEEKKKLCNRVFWNLIAEEHFAAFE